MSDKKRNVIFGVLCVLFIMVLFLRTSPAVIAKDLMKEFSILPVSLGLMSSAYFWAYGVVQIPVGFFSDRFGVRYTVFIFGLMGVLATLLLAFSQNVQMATWARLFMGIGTAGIWVPTLKYLSVAYKPDEFASHTSIISSVGSIGLLLSSFPLALMVERTSWRFPFIYSSVLMLFLIIIAWFLITVNTSTWKKEDKDSSSKKDTLLIWQYLCKYYKLIYFIVWAVLVYGVIFSFQGLWGVPYLQDVYSLSREAAGSNIMFVSIGLIFGGPFWSILSDRFFRARRPVIFLGTLGLFLTMISLFFQVDYPGSFLMSLKFFGLGFFGVIFLINLACVKEYVPLRITGTALGILNTLMLLGVGLFQSISGYYINNLINIANVFTAYKNAFLFYSICFLIALILVLFMPETFISNKQDETTLKDIPGK